MSGEHDEIIEVEAELVEGPDEAGSTAEEARAADPSDADPSDADPSDDVAQDGVEDGYTPDPDFSPDEADSVASRDAAALTRAAVLVSVVAILVAGLLALLGVPGMQAFARGLALGCAVATLNLRILANAAWRIFNQRVVSSLLSFAASFATLLGVAFWLTRAHPDWVLGYGVGLGLPGLAGLLYAVTETRAARQG